MKISDQKIKVVCFGEVLFDNFPTYSKIGGALLNVSVRLKSLGVDVSIISSVGEDSNGREIIRYLNEEGVNTNGISVTHEFPTGQVNVLLDNKGGASYDIPYPAAWDKIVLNGTHQEIVKDLLECSKIIGQQTLLISIGEGVNSQEELKDKRLRFEIGIRKLLQTSTLDLDVESVGEKHEELIPLPREKSTSLRQLDPLWESMQTKISILEERALLSPEFNSAEEEMMANKELFYSDIDVIIQNWSKEIQEVE